MKTFPILALGVLLAGCGSDAAPDTATNPATGTTPTVAAASANPDPRVATVRQQHEQLQQKQKEYIAQLTQLGGVEKLSPKRDKKVREQFASLLERSQANVTALEQLDPSKAQDPAQVALVGEIAEKQAYLISLAEKQLASIHNEHYLNNR